MMDVDVKVEKFYTLEVEDGQRIKINSKLLKYFGLIESTIEVLQIEDLETPIPILQDITAPILQWAIDVATLLMFYTIRNDMGLLYHIAQQLNRASRLRSPEHRLLLSLGTTNDEQAITDLSLLYRLANALAYLDAKEIGVIVVARVYGLVNLLSTSDIETLATKRKRSDETKSTLPLTPFYRREKALYNAMSELLPEDWVRAKRLVQKYIDPIRVGNRHQLYLKADGLYGYGNNEKSQLGFENTDEDEPSTDPDVIKLIDLPGKPLLIATKGCTSLCLTTSGLYGSGQNDNGQLGLPASVQRAAAWTRIEVEGQVLLLETSKDHTFVLTTTGLYSCGSNYYGELGLDDGDTKYREDHFILRRVDFPHETVLAIRCAQGKTVILTTTGLYGCGQNLYGELSGLLQGMSFFKLVKLDNSAVEGSILSVSLSRCHCMVVTDKHAYGSGSGGNGQLGIEDTPLGSDFENRDELTLVSSLKAKPILVSCGQNFSMMLTDDGLYATGRNNVGQLGIRDLKEITIFTKVIGYQGNVLSLECSDRSTIFITTVATYVVGFTINYPTGFTQAERTISPYVSRPLKLAIDMGYTKKTLDIQAIERGEPDKKKIKLQCQFCRGKARFIHSLKPVCSKYCVYTSLNK